MIRSAYYRSGARDLRIRSHGVKLKLNGNRVINGAGHTLFVDPSDNRARLLSRCKGAFDANAVRLWNRLCDACRPSIVVDIGGNYGEVVLARTYPDADQVHVVEANPRVCSYLQRSLEALPNSVITLHKVAASDRSGTATFHVPSESSGLASLVPEVGGKEITVSVVRLDELIMVPAGARLVFKIDVEGHERAVLEGAAGWFTTSATWAGMCEAEHLSLEDAAYLLDSFDVYLARVGVWTLEKVDDPARVSAPVEGYSKDVVLTAHGSTQPF